jgi:hypothetical protein
MQSTYRKVQQCRVNDGYIDDVDNLADAPATNRAPECIERIIMTAQIWATIVMVSGQIMGFHKGGYTMLAFMAVGGYLMHAYRVTLKVKSFFAMPMANPPPSSISLLTNPIKVLVFSPTVSVRWVMSFNTVSSKPNLFASKTLPAWLNLHEAKLALKTRVLPSLTYPFFCTSFTTKQIKTLAIAINNVFLPKTKMGINRKLMRIAVYTPLDFGGINFPSLQVLQDTKGIQHLLRHLQLGNL